MVKINHIIFGIAILSTDVNGYSNDDDSGIKMPPPYNPHPPDKPWTFDGTTEISPFLRLALGDTQLLGGETFDDAYQLPKGSMELCLDALYHGEEAQKLDLGFDFVVLNDAPKECSKIVRDVSSRYKNNKETDFMAAMTSEDSIRIDGFSAGDMQILLNINPAYFAVHVL